MILARARLCPGEMARSYHEMATLEAGWTRGTQASGHWTSWAHSAEAHDEAQPESLERGVWRGQPGDGHAWRSVGPPSPPVPGFLLSVGVGKTEERRCQSGLPAP